MNRQCAVIVCALFTIFFSIPSLIAIPSISPFLSSDVRHAASRSISMLREQGIWLVNATFDHIERNDNELCFVWKHAYQSRFLSDDPELLTTCIDEKK